MSKRQRDDKSISQRVANRGRERRLSRDDAFTAYAMDRLLCRLGKSSQASEFFLKGGVLVAQLIRAPHRFTRDIDVLRGHGTRSKCPRTLASAPPTGPAPRRSTTSLL